MRIRLPIFFLTVLIAFFGIAGLASAANQVPVADFVYFSTYEDEPINGTLTGSGATVSTLTFSKVTDAAYGAVTVSAYGDFTYAPNTGYYGTDSFTFKVSDGAADSAPGTVTIIVYPANTAPVTTASSASSKSTFKDKDSKVNLAPATGTMSASSVAIMIYNQDGLGFGGLIEPNPLGSNIIMTGYRGWPTWFTKGSTAFAGGVFDGQNIWLIPYSANAVVKVNKDTGAMGGYSSWPFGFTKGSYGFNGGVFDGQNIWLVPFDANMVVKVDKDTGVMEGYRGWPTGFTKGSAAFAGGVFDGQNIWLIPSDANMVVKVNKDTGAMEGYSSWPTGFTKGSAAFAGGVFDGQNIWLIPSNADRVVKVNKDTGAMEGYSSWPVGFAKGSAAFAGGAFDGQNIWLIPSNADRVVKVNKDTGAMEGFSSWPTGFVKGSAAFAGGTFDGQRIWLIPQSADRVVELAKTPVANAVSVATYEGSPLNDILAGSVGEGTTLTFSKVTDTVYGAVTVHTNGNFTYTPNPGYTGPDSFTFKVNDVVADSAPARVSITVSPRLTLTVTGITANNKTYDGTVAAGLNLSGAGISGVQPGDDVQLVTTGASGAFGDKQVGTGKVVTVTGLTLAGLDKDKYNLASYTTTANITPKTVTVSGLNAANKTYDGNTAATVSGNGALNGVADGDTVNLSGAPVGTFADKNAGAGKTVTVSGISLSGAEAGNYSLQSYSTTADITPKTVTVSGLNAANKIYDGNTAATVSGNGALNGVVDGDTINLSSAPVGTFADKNAGAGKTVTVSGLSLSGAKAGNYSLQAYSTTADITPKAITVSGLNAANKTYDGNTAATVSGNVALNGVVSGDTVNLSGTPAGTFADKNAGSGKTVAISGLSLNGAEAGNYSLQAYSTTADILPKSITITGLNAANKTYDGNTAATVSGTGALNGVVSGDTVNISGTATGTFADKNVGSGKTVAVSGLSLSGAEAGNYSLQSYSTTADITPKTVTLSGLNTVNKTYDGNTTATVSGTAVVNDIVYGDTVSLSGTPVGTFADKNVGAGKTVAVSGLNLSGAEAGNYSLQAYSTTADITPKTVTVSGFNAANKTYDGSTTATVSGTAVVNDIVNGDTVSLSGTPVGTFADKNVGAGKTVAVSGLSLNDAEAGNYSLQAYSTTADITPKAVTVSGLNAANKTYDGNTVATVSGTAIINDIVYGDAVSLSGDPVGTFADKNAGAGKTVTVSGLSLSGAEAGNYSLQAYSTTADILPKAITITGLNAANKIFDGNTTAVISGTAVLNDVVYEDTVSLSGTPVGTFADYYVGIGKIVTVSGLSLNGTDAGNYTVQPYTTMATIYSRGGGGSAPQTTLDNQAVTTVILDDGAINQKIENANPNTPVTIPVQTDANGVVCQLNGQTIKNLADKTATLEIKTATATYTLPAAQIRLDDVAAQIGQQVQLKDIQVKVTVTPSPAEIVKIVENSARRGEFTVVAPPVDFQVTCTGNDKTVEVSRFNSYVERSIAIPDGVDPTKITTGVVLNADGSVSHVPTRIVVQGGIYYAVINSLTNSPYAVIGHPVTFADVEKHWAKNYVNEMGSRMVINGVSKANFNPDRNITRAEFAAVIVRALGLGESGPAVKFSDVKAKQALAGAVSKAVEYGLVKGYADGSFKPDQAITREEAMAMAARAMKIAGYNTTLAADAAKTLLAKFSDHSQVAGWFTDSVALTVQNGIINGKGAALEPKTSITRAEAATIMYRLLTKAKLIDQKYQ